jgi:hypothetical protein
MKKTKTAIEVIDILQQVQERNKENYNETEQVINSLIRRIERKKWSEILKAEQRFENN